MIDVQSPYDEVNDMLNDPEARRAFATLTTSNTYFRGQFKDHLENHLKSVEASIFPAMDEAVTASEELLKRYAAK
ncbi:MAG: hypothetical protein FWD12_08025 [Alphaproteobacteria bacterium]|nr:hypothetical protein [Alphaproteobacteria bacterium]